MKHSLLKTIRHNARSITVDVYIRTSIGENILAKCIEEPPYNLYMKIHTGCH